MLSIIIISKNEEKELPILLESIKRQEYKDYEIILSDANSTDKTRAIAKKFSKVLPIKIVDGGKPSKGRNNGAKATKGDILLFLDADAILPDNFLNKSMSEFHKRNLDFASAILKPMSSKKIDKFLIKSYNIYAKSTQFFYPHGTGSCLFCKKWLFNKVNGFNEKIYLAEDHDFVRRCFSHGKYGLLKSTHILMNTRRLNSEGRLTIAKKYLRAEFLRIFKGELTEDSKKKIEYKL